MIFCFFWRIIGAIFIYCPWWGRVAPYWKSGCSPTRFCVFIGTWKGYALPLAYIPASNPIAKRIIIAIAMYLRICWYSENMLPFPTAFKIILSITVSFLFSLLDKQGFILSDCKGIWTIIQSRYKGMKIKIHDLKLLPISKFVYLQI